MAFRLLSHRQPRSVAALAGRRQASLIDGDNCGSPLATYAYQFAPYKAANLNIGHRIGVSVKAMLEERL
jgi:hypothetical protein